MVLLTECLANKTETKYNIACMVAKMTLKHVCLVIKKCDVKQHEARALRSCYSYLVVLHDQSLMKYRNTNT
jgi:hypothetical protein